MNERPMTPDEKISAALTVMNQIVHLVEPRRVRDDDAWARMLPLINSAEKPEQKPVVRIDVVF